MIVPHAYWVALLITLVTMLCWGSWANVIKVVKSWRFELLCYDYAIGILITSILAGVTFGSMGQAGKPFLVDLSSAHFANAVFGLLGGIVYCIANMLIVGAISVAGLGVAFPVGIGVALVEGVIWNYCANPQGNPKLLFGGVALIVIAIVLDGIAYSLNSVLRECSTREHTSMPEQAKTGTAKGLVLSVFGGILMGMFFPLVELGKSGPFGFGPYAIGVVFAIGICAGTVLFNAVFMRWPLAGGFFSFRAYLNGSASQHLWGIFGGVVWAVGTLSSFVVASAPHELQVGPAVSYALGQGATMIGALWGVLVWREFKGGNRIVVVCLTLMFAFFIAGLVTVSIAPILSK